MSYASHQDMEFREEMVPPLFTNYLLRSVLYNGGAYYITEDKAEYDRWTKSHLMSNYGWKNNSTTMRPWFDIGEKKGS